MSRTCTMCRLIKTKGQVIQRRFYCDKCAPSAVTDHPEQTKDDAYYWDQYRKQLGITG